MAALQQFAGLRPCGAARQAFRASSSSMATSSSRAALVVRASQVAAPVQLDCKTLSGADAGQATLGPLRVADDETSKGLVHRYVTTVQQNARQGNASTLTRGEVRGGGRKPYKQKGTGNARRGTRRSPLMPGGGISFGPKPRDWTVSMNKKEKRLALATALQSAAPDMLACADFGAMEQVSTKGLVQALAAMGVAEGEKVLLIVNEPNEKVYLSGRNIPTLAINTANAVQVYDVLNADRIVVEQSALAYLNEWFGQEQ